MTRRSPADRTGYAVLLADRMRRDSHELAQRWLHQLSELLPVDSQAVFPSAEILDHIPLLVEQIADYLQAPGEREIAANTSVIEKAKELGQLRHRQQATVHQILREYDILADILEEYVVQETARLAHPESRGLECLRISKRLGHAVRNLMQTTVDTFVGEYTARISDQTTRLESFNRMLMHELRNPLGTLVFAVDLLTRPEVSEDKTSYHRLVTLVRRNLEHTIQSVRGLERLVLNERTVDAPNSQRAHLSAVAGEAARQLADMAESRRVEIRIDPDLPEIVVDTGQLELVLVNLLSNAIKYSDPAKSERYVEVISADGLEPDGRAPDGHTLCVRDNGIGIPGNRLASVFTRFVRAHRERDEELGAEGSGLGLSIVEDSLRVLGGRIRVESAEGDGTAFYITLPDDRDNE